MLRNLQGTLSHGLLFYTCYATYPNNLCESDWGSSIKDRRSTLGFCIYLGGNLVGWSSKKQHLVARSPSDVKYGNIANAVADIAWFVSLLSELREPVIGTPTIWCELQK